MWSVLVVVPVLATFSSTLGKATEKAERHMMVENAQLEAFAADPLWKSDDVIAKLEAAGEHKLAMIVKAAIDDPTNPVAPALKKFANDITNEVHTSKIAAEVMASEAHQKVQHATLLKMGQLAMLAKLQKMGIKPNPKHASSFAQLEENFDLANFGTAPSYQEMAAKMEQAEEAPSFSSFGTSDVFQASDALDGLSPHFEAPQYDYEGNPTPDGSLDQLTNQLVDDAAESDIMSRQVTDAAPFSLLQNGAKVDPAKVAEYEAMKAEYLAKHGAHAPIVKPLGGEAAETAKKLGLPEPVVHVAVPTESNKDLAVELKEDEKRAKKARDEFDHTKAMFSDLPTPPMNSHGRPDYVKAMKIQQADLVEKLSEMEKRVEKKSGKSFHAAVADNEQVMLARYPELKNDIISAFGGKMWTEKDEQRQEQDDDNDDDDDDSLLQVKAKANMRKDA